LTRLFELAVVENIERDDMHPLDLAATFNEMLTTRINLGNCEADSARRRTEPAFITRGKNPKGRPYTLKEIAAKLRKDYHWVRSRAALVYLTDGDKAS
jgi:hypothetical protein